MRPFIITILTILIFNSYAQTGKKMKVFKKIEYINGIFYQQTSDTIEFENDLIDIYFFKKHFYSPYYLPEKFTDSRYISQTILLWRNPNGDKDFRKNWQDTYSYDSIGRVINFTHSSCLVCSSIAYNYSVTYNCMGQVAIIANKTGSKDRYEFYYNKKGDIIKFSKYSSNELVTKITVSD